MRILLATTALLLAGCSSSVAITAEGEGTHGNTDGSLTLSVGERLHLHVYAFERGYETESVACSNEPDDDVLVTDDATIISVENLHRRETLVTTGNDPAAADYAITGLRPGNVILSTKCGNQVGTRVVHVTP